MANFFKMGERKTFTIKEQNEKALGEFADQVVALKFYLDTGDATPIEKNEIANAITKGAYDLGKKGVKLETISAILDTIFAG